MAEKKATKPVSTAVIPAASPVPMDLGRPDHPFPPVIVLHHPTTQRLAEQIVIKTNKNSKESKLSNTRSVVMSQCIQWNQFRDGWPNIFIDSVTDLAGRDVIFVGSFHSPDALLFEQLALIYMLPRYLIRSLRVILPFSRLVPWSELIMRDKCPLLRYRQTRIHAAEVVPAQTLAHMLSVIPMAARGPVQLVMFDIHALQERFYFSHQVIPRLLSAIPLLIDTLKRLEIDSTVQIAFPDEGAYKRFHSFFPSDWPTITCIKVRNNDKRVVKIKEGDPKDGDIVIVDDLVQTGGTLIECAKECLNQGAKSVSAFVTHAVFPEQSWQKFTDQGADGFKWKQFWITDSIPHAYDICQHSPFKLITISDAIVESLLSYDLLEDRQ